MYGESETSASDVGGEYRGAIDTYRSIAKWVVSSFGAVGGALVVGVQLTSLGELHGLRLAGSLAAIALVFSAVLSIIKAAVRVLLPVRLSHQGFAAAPQFQPLRDDLEADPSPLQGEATSPGALAQRYEEYLKYKENAQKAYEDAERAHQARRDEDSLIARDNARRTRDQADEDADALHETVMRIVWLGRMLWTRRLFRRAMRTIYVALIVAAIGAVGFAYAANPPATHVAQPPPSGHLTVHEPKTCVDLYLALDSLVDDEPDIASHWPTSALGAQDRACGFRSITDLARFLRALARH